MTYTFIGGKDYLNNEINKIAKDFSIENIVHYNLEENDIKTVIEDLDTVSLFGNKLVITYNINLLDNSDILIKYLDNPSSNTLILTSQTELDKRKKITKVLKEKTKYKEFLSYNVESFIQDKLEGYKMSKMAMNLLISYCSSNLLRIENELEKLKTYKIEEKEITEQDIENLVKKSFDATIFDLIDSINNNNKDKIFKIYNELLKEGETEEKIMYTIANHYRLLFQISERVKTKSDDEIIKEYRMHPYRLTKLKEQTHMMNQEQVLHILKSLSDIDIGIKKGEKDITNSMFIFFESL